MITIIGKITPGLGIATRTVAEQKEEFIRRGLPLMESMHTATINVDISPKTFKIANFDYFFKEVPWGNNRIEDFGFIKIAQILFEGQAYNNPGYIYIPYNSPHFTNHSQFEIISVLIPNVSYGKTIEIVIESENLKIDSNNIHATN